MARQTQNTLIESIGTYLPPKTVTTDEVLQGCSHKLRFPLEKVTGIQTRRKAGESEFSIDLAKKAVARCLAASRFSPDEIDLLICCNISRCDGPETFVFEPSTSIKLKKDFGFGNAVTFDITNACAGMFTGIYIVNAFLQAHAIRRGLVVSGEYITHLADTAQREIEGFMDPRLACLTLGDGAAALILERSPGGDAGFQAIELQTLGKYSRYCVAKTSDRAQGGMIMYTDSVNLTDVGVKHGAMHALGVLEKAGWRMGHFQHLIMHQTSKMTMDSARRAINRMLNQEVCHAGNTIINVAHRGNTASTTHVLATMDRICDNTIRSGDRVVYSINASGLTVGTALYTFDDLPDRLRGIQAGAPAPRQRDELSVQDEPASGPTMRIASVGIVPPDAGGIRDSFKLLTRAALNCLEGSSYGPRDIELLIVAGVYRSDYILEPANAALLAGELNMNASTMTTDGTRTLAFDVFNGALGLLNACHVAQQMILAGRCRTAMVVASEIENNAGSFPDELVRIRETGSAIILEASPSTATGFARFLFQSFTDHVGAYSTYLAPKAGDVRLHVSKRPDLEALYRDAIVCAVRELCVRDRLDMALVSKIFPPQISSAFIRELSVAMNMPPGMFVDAVGTGHDLFTSSLPFALRHATEHHLVNSGDTVLIIAVGSGIQVGCALYRF